MEEAITQKPAESGYKGLVFHTSSREQMGFTSGVEMVEVEKIWIPG